MGVQTKWAEKAAKNSQECWKNLITSRIDVALEHVRRNLKYIRVCQQQNTGQKVVDNLLKKLDKEDQDIIRQYYDKEIEKENYELEETYMQGVKDGIWLLLGLGVLQVKELP